MELKEKQPANDNGKQMVIDREESKKNKRGKLGIKGKTFIVVLVSGIVVSLSVGAIDYAYNYAPDKSDTSLSSVVETYHSTLAIDEALNEETYSKLAVDMEKLENTIALNNKLYDLDLSKYNKGLNSFDVSTLTSDDIETLIEEFNDSKGKVDLKTPTQDTTRFYDVVATLTSYIDSFNTDIYVSSVDSIVDYTDLLIKSCVAQSLDLSLDQMVNMNTNLRNTDARELIIRYTDTTSGKKYEMDLSFFNSMNALVKKVRDLIKLTNFSANQDISEADLNVIKKQEEAILNHLKAVMKFSFYVEDGTVHQNGNQLFYSNKGTK